MHPLSERALNEAFLTTVEDQRRDGRPLVIDRDGAVAVLPAEELGEELRYGSSPIAKLDREIAEFCNQFSLRTRSNHTT
jgi:hypothetical protein